MADLARMETDILGLTEAMSEALDQGEPARFRRMAGRRNRLLLALADSRADARAEALLLQARTADRAFLQRCAGLLAETRARLEAIASRKTAAARLARGYGRPAAAGACLCRRG